MLLELSLEVRSQKCMRVIKGRISSSNQGAGYALFCPIINKVVFKSSPITFKTFRSTAFAVASTAA